MAHTIWERLGNVPNYCEPFLGSGAVLLARPHKPKLETVNDADHFVANFFRATQQDPEEVAYYADAPVIEADLHARHLWLVNEGKRRLAALDRDPELYDTLVAGWWLWGICQWIGGEWCSGKGPHKLEDTEDAEGIRRRIPHLGGGMGIHRKLPNMKGSKGIHGQLPGVERRIPALGTGQGIHALGAVGAGAGRCAERSAFLLATIQRLRDRLRDVRVTCGDWERLTGPSVTFLNGTTGIFLDPPYELGERDAGVYAQETDCAAAVREWALANGDNPGLRICLAGYQSPTYTMPETWEAVSWVAQGGYGNHSDGRGSENRHREMLFFSPHCLKVGRTRQLRLLGD